MTDLPVVTSSERKDYKRCPKKWYWAWRKGLTPKRPTVGALDLGTWKHEAFDRWYGLGYVRNGSLVDHFLDVAEVAIERIPSSQRDKADELLTLGVAMARGYTEHYGDDPDVYVIGGEIPLEFVMTDHRGNVVAKHSLKPDLVFKERGTGDVWLMEHKTAGQIVTEHLTIDDQARPYGAMAERALRRKGLLAKDARFRGIMYNFLRKAHADDRLKNDKGQSLNKNGTVSKKQPAPRFKRYRVEMTKAAKILTLERLQTEVMVLTGLTQGLRSRKIDPAYLPKTPTKGCPRFCDYFPICSAEDQGADITQMQRDMYRRANPYLYTQSTEDRQTFEME